jgi:TetR/AcrR family transcriptional regulator, transcriptional repressor of aconitase
MPKIAEETREERRTAILTAAVECLSTFGYAGTSMRTIAEAAGLTKGGLYAYFDSKEAILLELAERHMEQQLGTYAARPGETALAQLERLFGGGQPEAAKVARAIMDLWAFASDLPAVRAALSQRYTCYRSAVADVVRRVLAEGAFRQDVDAEQVAALILAARDGIAYHALSLRLPVDGGRLNALLHAVLEPYLTGSPHLG